MSSTATAMRGGGSSVLRSTPGSSGLYDVLELILDKGLVIDAFVRVSLVGIELLTIDARVVVASVDTYLRFAEAVDRLNIRAQSNEETTNLRDMTSALGGGGGDGGGGLGGGLVDRGVDRVMDRVGLGRGHDDDDDNGRRRNSRQDGGERDDSRPARSRRRRNDDEDRG
ncbi:MAG TPA: gas vesicle protein GvpJ [Acidimicrobiales bacterium]|nr:gas vesicle protein GvpJ [Acidimicrobiales bacterium]